MMPFRCQSGIAAFADDIGHMAAAGSGIDTGEQMATFDRCLIFKV
jgi:hypothetical protein